ncbi:hypothetical protein JCM10908_003263 [Rhodotorula pacifica]|uniref:MFS transporter n=1 Tax=Rhodotorula pacifica TaxID=1495444 RepID=UPI00317CD442
MLTPIAPPPHSVAADGRDAPTPTPPIHAREQGQDAEVDLTLPDGMTALETIKSRGVDLQKEWSESPEHPQNWPDRRRWTIALVIALTGFLSTADSSVFVADIPTVQERYHASKELATLTISLYVIGLGCGPFVFAPLSELYGRQMGYVISMIGFTFMNLGCCFVDSLPGFIVLRFLAGFFGSSGPGLGVATISDLFKPFERGRPIAIYGIGPMLGPVIGSLLGEWLVLISWRWSMRLMTSIIGLNTCCVILFMRETYAPVLERKWLARRLAAETSEKGEAEAIAASAAPQPDFREIAVRTFTRPPRLLMNPICALFATYYAITYGAIYIFIVSTPLLFSRRENDNLFSYNWPAGSAGLGYVPIGIGFVASATTAALTQDRIYKYLSRRYGTRGLPEYRLVLTQIGMVVFPAGLLMYGWSAQAQTHWIVPMIGSVVFSYGLMLCFNSLQNYLVDAFYPYGAAAMAGATLLRSVTGAILPIFSPIMYKNLGYGVGNTIIACVLLPAIPAPFVVFKAGERLRERWKFQP